TLDGHMDEAERDRILAIVKGRFGLSDHDAEALLAEAQQEVARSVQLLGFTKAIKDNFAEAERVRMVEMLWEVAYADGHLHDYEANLVRRVAGLLFVSDQESGAARKRALARLGLGDGLA
ncbi:MAG TPA: TerB family tellurite resistance protein, partial [Candidatus Omnitrophota bacterium]|nr:TerB family tellurite resistance protein [Candidatus Omnitrophota bacterium]